MMSGKIKYQKETGWIDGVRHCPSPNHDERPEGMAIDCLVIHGISLPPGQYGGDYIDRLFTNTLAPDDHDYFSEICYLQVSSHLLIRRCGEIVQYVPLDKRAWHAGVSEFKSRTCCNDFAIGIELEGCDEEPYEKAQYTSLIKLTRLIMENYPTINSENIVGHSDIAPGRKTDPGPAFDWAFFKKQLS